MWLRNSVLLGVLLLTGCGFKPLYGARSQNTQTAALLDGVKIDYVSVSKERMGQQLKIILEDRLNPGGAVPANPKYRLKVDLKETISAIGVAQDGTVSRYNLYLNSAYTLYRIADGQQMTSGSISNVSSYNNVTNAYFSTYISKEDAIKRGITELSEMYRARLSAYLAQNGGNPPVEGDVVKPEAPPLQNVLEPRLRNNYQ
jgi:LPS-assembly lipoprotein